MYFYSFKDEMMQVFSLLLYHHFQHEWRTSIGIDVYEQCGGAVFENLRNLVQIGADIVAKIDQGFYKGRENSIVDWWKTGIHW